MTLHELLAQLARRGISLHPQGSELRVQAPKNALTADLRAALAHHKPQLLALLADTGSALPEPMEPAPRNAELPLSFAQQRLWLVQQIDESTAVYHVAGAAWLDGALDCEVLSQSLLTISERHEALRTTFVDVQGRPVQRLGAARFPLSFEDLRDVAGAQEQAERIASAFVREPFRLDAGPLARAKLVRAAPDRHLFVLCMHHMVSDAWSISVLMHELTSLYEAGIQGRAAALPALSIQYADFAAWQRTWLTGNRMDDLVTFWRRRLAGVPEVLELPTDRPRASTQSFRGAVERCTIDRETANALKELARGEEATLFQVLLSAFQVFLHRYSGQESFAVGTPVANRSRAEIGSLIGFFVNTIVLRADLGGDPTFAHLVSSVKAETLDAYAHEDLPFETLVAELSPARSLSRNPLFQVMFALQNAPSTRFAMADLKLTPVPVDLGVSKFDVYVSLEEQPDGTIAGEWEYATDLFAASTVRRMSTHFNTLLGAIVGHFGQKISQLPLMPRDEERRILFEGNDTAAEWPATKTLPDLMAEQVRRTPQAIAVVDRRERISYAELDHRSNRIAHALLRMGVERETLIGVCVHRSCDMVVAALGILKAGAAYVPLDPAYPKERLRFLIQDAGMPVIVMHQALAGIMPEHGAQLLVMDRERTEPGIAPNIEVRPDQLAYVIYTSGSTGQPKGILIEHRNAAAMLAWGRSVFTAKDLAGTLASTSLSFDLSVFEIFLPLITGGSVIIAENALDLKDHPAAGEVTLVNTVPSAAAELVRSGGFPASVRVVNLAGEPLKRSLADALYALGHIDRVYDLYGPGETTTYSTFALRERGGPEVVGRPIANTRVYILDAHRRPVPIGVTGEIYIAGAGVTRGYLRREDLTRERYIGDPFFGGRMYRTGDLGRFEPDGEVRYLGRLDHQVKIRGFRIELGEIDHALSAHPGIRDCVTTLKEDADGSKQLVAYYSGPAESHELRTFVERILPPFMVPAVFVRMDALPITPNGKINRAALPDQESETIGSRLPYAAPQTGEQDTLCKVWAEVLGLERVGIHDNFFELGGDSIRAMQVTSRLREKGLPVKPRDLFEHQTISAVEQAAPWRSIKSQAEDDPDTGPLRLTSIQRWALRGDRTTANHYNQWVLLEVPFELTAAMWRRAFAAIVDQHGALRLRFHHRAEGWTAAYGPRDRAIEFEVSTTSDLEGERGRAHASLNLENGPLSRALLFVGGAGPRRLFWTIHHLVVDAVSWRVLVDDLAAAIDAISRGEAPALPRRTASYRRWAKRLLETENIDIETPEGDFGSVADSASCKSALNERETRALLEFIPQAYRARTDEALLAALGAALARWSGCARQVIAFETHGRDRIDDLDVSRTVGWFTDVNSIEIELSPEAPIDTLLPAAKVARRKAAHSFSRASTISFNYLGQVDPSPTHHEGWSVISYGLSAAPERLRPYPLAFEASITSGLLIWEIEYSTRHHSATELQRLADEFAATLRALIAHCQDFESGHYAPSDFPDAQFTQAGMDALVARSPKLHRNIEDIRRASSAQEGILFHALLGQDDGVYVTQIAMGLEGCLDVPSFVGAWQDVTARHAALRSCFARDQFQNFVQVVLRRVAMPVVTIDRSVDLEELLASDRHQGLDPSIAPLSRVRLMRRGDTSWRAIWTFHHGVLDGWSVAIILKEVAECYGARIAGRPATLPPRRVTRQETRQDDEAARAFWREEIEGCEEPVPLPFEHPPRSARAHAQECGLVLDAASLEPLKHCLRRHHLTLHSVLQGAWALLIARCGGRDEVLFGGAVSGRSTAGRDTDAGVGLLMRTVPVRVRVQPDSSVVDWLTALQARHTLREAHAHVPLVSIQHVAGASRGAPMFESLLVLENYPVDESIRGRLGDLVVGDVKVVERPHYPLTIIAAGEDALALTAIYDGNRFDAEDASRILKLYRDLILAFRDAPAARLRDVALLDAASERQIVFEWNDTRRAYPLHGNIVDLIEEQAARTPDATAVVFEDKQLTYAELDRRANGVATMIRSRRVAPEALVAVMIERSLELPIALLGILKAGAAYVPIDLDQPSTRRNSMLGDSGVTVVLDVEQVRNARAASSPPVRAIDPSGMAYMIYTSGSTGAPKGAMNTHAGLLNRLLWMQEAFGLEPGEGVLQKTPFSFDVAVWEFFWPLIAGARLVMARPGGHLDRDYIVDAIERYRITTIHFVPSMLQIFLEAKSLHRCGSLRRVIASGEALTPDVALKFRERLTAELHNLYGPTEAAVDVSWYECPRKGPITTVPIGRPIANTQLHALGADGRSVPVGIPGELYIGGVQVGRGYWNQPGLTAERFVPNPFGPGRLYRTGDLARYLPEGCIEFLGRMDHQVKIRGVRIELGEIEAVLRSNPQVGEAVVTVHRDRGDLSLAAYCTPRNAGATLRGLLEYARGHLPEAMVPSWFVVLTELPRLRSGKIDRRALPAPQRKAAEPEALYLTGIEAAVARVWKDVLGLEQVGLNQNFFDLGGHSLKMMRVHGRLQEMYGPKLALLDLFNYPTVSALARFLGRAAAVPASQLAPRRADEGPYRIAVIGMACRFPGASNVDEFWRNLVAGQESIQFFSDEALRAAGERESRLRDPRYVRAYGALDEADRFDAAFFDVPASEAEILDPQQRVFLEVAWEAFERAGYDPAQIQGPVGVFAGAGLNTYALRHIYSRRDIQQERGTFALMIASDKDYLPTRVSYKLNLTGPSISVQTACSTSLVAISVACDSLLRGDCRAALAGGVTIRFPQIAGYVYEEGMIFSPDGHCRPFDANSQGTVAGSGAGAVLLKRLEDALADGDHVHAVIQSAVTNNDGSAKAGYTAPSVEGQSRAIAQALERAGVSPEAIEYLETHGTATKLGDPIEVAALTRAFRERTGGVGFCGIGSVKSNIGHLDAAAGVAGLIKTVLAVEHGIIPPSLHFERPNPLIDFESSPFFVNAALREWRPEHGPRRAGVSSFGLGGTNAHAVIEEAPNVPPQASQRSSHLIAISARSAAALDRSCGRMADALENGVSLPDAAYTLLTGRRAFARRRAIVCRGSGDAVRQLRGSDPAHVISGVAETNRPVVFMFSGHGTHYAGMGRGLYDADPMFREALDRCTAILRPYFDLPSVLWGAASESFTRMAVGQPSLLALQYALTEMWRAWGVTPAATIGYSAGEYAAACVAGVFSIGDALPLIATRGRLSDATPPGAMLAVSLPEHELASRLNGHASVAIITAPDRCVVSGAPAGISELRSELEARGVDCRHVNISIAPHSTFMEPVLEPFGAAVCEVVRNNPRVPFVSNVTGTWITAEEATSAAYWARHVRAPVRFSDGIATLLSAHPSACIVEIGPGRSLAAPVRRHPARPSTQPVLTTLRHPSDPENDESFLLNTIGGLWTAGVSIDLKRCYAQERRRRVPLPTYPFERKRYVIEAGGDTASEPASPASVADFVWVPGWQRSASPIPKAHVDHRRWLVLTAGTVGDAIAFELRSRGAQVISASIGMGFEQCGAHDFVLNPSDPGDFSRLLAATEPPDGILHAWSVGVSAADILQRGFYSLLFLIQALANRPAPQACRIVMITRGAQRVTGDEVMEPLSATAAGPLRVIQQEDEQVRTLAIDLDSWSPDLAAKIVHEADTESSDNFVAYRHGRRWVRRYAPAATTVDAGASLRAGGVYLITGGLSGIGLELAEEIASAARGPTLALVSRDAGAPRHEAAVRRLESMGAKVNAFSADVADASAMQTLFDTLRAEAGVINGVVHAAGIPGGGTIRRKDRQSCEAEFAAKLDGTIILYNLVIAQPLDFFLLCSSMSALTGGFGSVAYTAACTFQDAFAEAVSSPALPVISVNWSRWRHVGMAIEVERIHQRLTGHELPGGITPSEGREAFRRILSRPDLERVIVAPFDPLTAESNARSCQGLAEEDTIAEAESAGPASTDTEAVIEAAWRSALGTVEIPRNSSFASLGGDSLLALRVLARLRRDLSIQLPLRAIFEEPTLAALARRIDAIRWAQHPPLAAAGGSYDSGVL